MKRLLFCAALLLFGRQVKAQETTAQITSHTNGQTVTDPNITITWIGCSNHTQTTYTTMVDTAAISTSQTSNPTPCPDFLIRKNYSASKTFTRGGNHDIYVKVCDGVNPCGEDSLHVFYAAPGITVTPKNIDAPFVVHGTSASYPFKIKNTGAVAGTANLSFACTNELAPCSLSRTTTNGPIALAAGDSLVDTLSYEGTNVGTGTASVTATYTNFTGISDSGYVRVSVRDVPTAILTSPPNGQVFTNPNITVTFKGCSNVKVTSGAASLNGSPLGTPGTTSGSKCIDRDSVQNYTVPALLNPGGNTISVSACDASFLCSDTVSVSVSYSPPSVSVTPDAGSAPSIAQNTTGNYSFSVANTGGSSATAKFSVFCTAHLNCPVAPDSVILAPGASATVVVSYFGANIGNDTVTLAATYKEFPSVTDNGSVTVNVTPPPTDSVTVTPVLTSKTVAAGNTTISFNIRYFSETTSSSTFSLATIATGSVTSCDPLNPVTLTAGASPATVDVSCSISTSGASGSVKLTASRASPSSISNFGITNITINPVYRISVLPPSANASVDAGAPTTHYVTIKNTSSNTVNAITVSLPSPSCSGLTLGNCTVPSNSAQIAQGEETSPIAFSYTGLAAGSETVTLTPSGTVTGEAVQPINGSLTVSVESPPPQGVTVAVLGRNPGTTIDKAGCLTIAAGQNAAYECGDLRIVHPLPATVTMDRSRGPALIYNSRHANGGGLLAADVTYTSSTPDSLQATIMITGQPNIVKRFPWSSACATACRIVVPISTTQPTNMYPVTLEISAMSGSTAVATGSATDTVVIVNRASSPYGSGWWLDGLESLITVSSSKMLWIGGDGSARVYTQSGAGSSVYTVNPAYDRPDTLQFVSASNTWRRQLGDSAYVEFNTIGQHIKTRNALGWITTFSYTSNLLDSINLPVRTGSSPRYRFWYSNSKLDSVQAPNATFSRTTKVARNSSLITSITDPGNRQTSFSYDGSNRIISRTNKLGDPTTFQYDDAGGLKQSSLNMSRTNGVNSAITTNFIAAETRSASSSNDTPVLPSKVFTHLQGPRNVGDSTNIIVNRWGAPDSVTNAAGQRTLISRASSAFPALATKVIAANGLETRAFFNARGLTDSTVAIDPYNNNDNPSTKYFWNPKWNQVDSVVGPTNERKRMFYRSSSPLVDSMRIGTQPSRMVRFTYTAENQVRGVTEPGSSPDSVAYDALGNAVQMWTPTGRAATPSYSTLILKDAIGRDTLVVPADTTGTKLIRYDQADRVRMVIGYGPQRPYSLVLNPSFTADTAQVTQLIRTDSSGYDAEGNLTSKLALSSTSDVQLNENMSYDAAGRLVKRKVGTGADSLIYDAAGNVTSARHRSGKWITQTYDVLNRLLTRVVPDTTYAKEGCGDYTQLPLGQGLCQLVFPYYPNTSNDGLLIPADTSRFVYDTLGNMIQANNRNARIRRTYYRNGAIKSDTMALGSYTSPLTDEITLGQSYSYDRSGRDTSMVWPLGVNKYTYNDFGALNTLTDVNGTQFRYVYTLGGQVDSLLLGTYVKEKRAYDLDGRQIFRTRSSSAAGIGFLVSDSLFYDKSGRIRRAWETVKNQGSDQTVFSYDGLGAVLARESANETSSSDVQEFRNDAFGNVMRRLSRRSAGQINNAPFTMTYSPKGELTTQKAVLNTPPDGIYQKKDETRQNFLGGRMMSQSELVQNPNDNSAELQVAMRQYYGSDDRLMAVQRYSDHSGTLRDGTWEEYRYDALGRRVMTRVRRNGGSPYDTNGNLIPLCSDVNGSVNCRSYYERVWWDGDQSLLEMRFADGTADVSNNAIIGNVHALDLDEPLATIAHWDNNKGRIINYNWRGQGLSSEFEDGTAGDATTGGSEIVDWPAATQAQTYFTPSFSANTDNTPRTWLGTFIQNGKGTTGMLYRRNRYFDTNTGRFTQEDPIGIAGGLNAYGFAAGDPINFSDPFGLCSPMPQCLAGLGGLQDASQDIASAVKHGPAQLASAASDPLKGEFLLKLATIPLTVAGDIGFAEDVAESSNILIRTARSLQHTFTKHGGDFGLSGTWNSARAIEFSRAIHRHINDPAVRAISGVYRGQGAIHYLNPETGLNVISDLKGNLVGGWRLGANQLRSVLANGRLY